jgi:hypothetical protein
MTDNFIVVTIPLTLNFRKEIAPGLNIGALLKFDFDLVNSSHHNRSATIVLICCLYNNHEL